MWHVLRASQDAFWRENEMDSFIVRGSRFYLPDPLILDPIYLSIKILIPLFLLIQQHSSVTIFETLAPHTHILQKSFLPCIISSSSSVYLAILYLRCIISSSSSVYHFCYEGVFEIES
ncbi:hypothetical protein HanRHA438_Chr04g0170171 [Helianthus annuus]|uniref:Uncharacterized protein n=1 Tax=Helianthus annuus TaxID=4232 RepID=A0A251SMF3_HELAN|nr:hypothetical protein HanXRQr2_Chr04g0159991 [Helianthus annuus]KAJ0580649.1 hypothetical protein HanHA300_Chr04g0131671 [Helianthus annuus]KAJ0588285.1 hypothetical protein HanIR_Chr04g0172781 [Helianthus annuus]KAJ0596602.1 hypothetical protein HanHA89_Chr04g0144671 [Helianthus annuus]KAJ0757265.1 hypothetical protein HanLR1_Chr04g0136631 [Helianthus annuus]